MKTITSAPRLNSSVSSKFLYDSGAPSEGQGSWYAFSKNWASRSLELEVVTSYFDIRTGEGQLSPFIPARRLGQVCCVLFFEMLSCRWKTCLGVFELLFVNQDSVRLGLAVRLVKALKTQN